MTLTTERYGSEFVFFSRGEKDLFRDLVSGHTVSSRQPHRCSGGAQERTVEKSLCCRHPARYLLVGGLIRDLLLKEAEAGRGGGVFVQLVVAVAIFSGVGGDECEHHYMLQLRLSSSS